MFTAQCGACKIAHTSDSAGVTVLPPIMLLSFSQEKRPSQCHHTPICTIILHLFLRVRYVSFLLPCHSKTFIWFTILIPINLWHSLRCMYYASHESNREFTQYKLQASGVQFQAHRAVKQLILRNTKSLCSMCDRHVVDHIVSFYCISLFLYWNACTLFLTTLIPIATVTLILLTFLPRANQHSLRSTIRFKSRLLVSLRCIKKWLLFLSSRTHTHHLYVHYILGGGPLE